jgi:hypothetical protein
MALRVEDWVLRGEIDNRRPGRVHGRLWVAGRSEPLELDLAGNCRRDLAGCRLEFRRRAEIPAQGLAPGRSALAPYQKGFAGDLTASRKIKVPVISGAELEECLRLGIPFETRLANAVCLEWYSHANGRMLLESADFEVTISEPAWQLSAAEEQREREDTAERVRRFLEGSAEENPG